MQAELVALRVLYHDRPRPAVGVLMTICAPSATRRSASAVFALLVGVDVQMDPVLARLTFGHPLEEEPRFDTGGVGTRCHVTERRPSRDRDRVLSGEPAGGDELGVGAVERLVARRPRTMSGMKWLLASTG